MHYYQFNIGDYTSHTARLSLMEDLAYRRLLDLYYLNERPLNGCSKTVAREIGMVEHHDSVDYILNKFFTKDGDSWVQKRADQEIKLYQNKKKAASRAGKASAKARQVKGSEQESNDRSTTVQPNIKHKPRNINQEPINTSSPPAQKAEAVDFKLAEFILDGIKRFKPNLKPPNMSTWAEDCRKMREIDGRTPREIAEVFKWANNDHFWQANILSPGKLRKQFDQLEIKSKQVPSNAQKSPRIDHDDTSWIYGGAGSEACERPVQGAAGDQAWLEGSVLESGGD